MASANANRRYDELDIVIEQGAAPRSEMFAKTFREWFDRFKAQRNDARAVLQRAEDIENSHSHMHDHEHGGRDFDHRHDRA